MMASAVRLSAATANPTVVAYSLAIESLSFMSSDLPAAAERLDRSRDLATRVRNDWLLNVIIGLFAADLSAAAGRTEDALVEYLDAAATAHRTGWTVHAWALAWSAVAMLVQLGRDDVAAVFVGACEASGVTRSPQQVLPPPVDALIEGNGERHLRQMYAAGANLKLPDLIRVATGEQDLPAVDG